MTLQHHLPLILLLASLTQAETLPENRTETRLETQAEATLQTNTQPNTPEATPTSTDTTPVLNEAQLLQNPQLLYRALQSSLLLRNTEGVRVLLPLYKRLPPPHDELLLTLCQALLAQTDGDHPQAIEHYRQALSQNPEMPTVRFDLARSLFANHENEAAHDQFTRLRSDSTLPDWARNAIDQYLHALDKRTDWSFYGSLNYLQDNNINNSGQAFQLGSGIVRPAPPESAHGIGYRLGAERDWPINGNWRLRTHLSTDGKFYWDNHPYDDLAIRLEAGPAYRNAHTEAALLPYFERRWYGTDPFNRESGLRSHLRHWLDPKHQIGLTTEWGKLRHDTDQYIGRRRFDGQSSAVSATWLYIQNPRQYWLLATSYTRRKANDTSQSYTRTGIRLGWTREWTHGLSTSLNTEIANRQYDSRNFFGIRVNQNEYSANLSLWHRRIHHWGITPRLVLTWQKNQSNFPINNYSKANAYIQISKTF